MSPTRARLGEPDSTWWPARPVWRIAKSSDRQLSVSSRFWKDSTTQLILLNLSTRLSNALDRLNIHTAGDLLRFPLQRIYGLRGVGNKTRRELGSMFKKLRQRLPEVRMDAGQLKSPEPEGTDDAGQAQLETATIETIAQQAASVGKGGRARTEQTVVHRYLGWESSPGVGATLWPSQSDLAPILDVTRQRIGQAIVAARERWSRLPSLTSLRDELEQVLKSLGGIATHEEVMRALLAAHATALEESDGLRMASVATRAALEAEKHRQDPRFEEYRSGKHIFISLHPELKAYALHLGSVADRLANQEALPSPSRVLEGLRAVPRPDVPVGLPEDKRLPQLAVAASDQAALSSRLEIYPRGLEARRALALAQNALFGGTLTVAEMRDRVRSRYPEALPLPDRPELDQLVQEIGLDLKWNPSAAEGTGAYEPVYRESLLIESSEPLPERRRTHVIPVPPSAVEPRIAAARVLEEKLQYSAREGAFLVLSIDGKYLQRAWEELQRFKVTPCNLDALFLDSLKRRAEARKAKWEVVLRADAADHQSADWRNLQRLVDECLPEIEQELRKPDGTRLIANPGLLARYDRMDLIARLADDVGRKEGIFGLWILVPAQDQSPLPVINHKAIPVTNAAQHARLTEDWVFNRHRGQTNT